MGKGLGCVLTGIVGIVIWIITVLLVNYVFSFDAATGGAATGFNFAVYGGVLIGGFILGLIPIILCIIFVSKKGNKDSIKPPTLTCGKCKNKSTVFDGLICPNCGEEFSTKTNDHDEFGLF